MAFEYIKSNIDFDPDFSPADVASIEAAMATAYNGSPTAKHMFDNWVFPTGQPDELTRPIVINKQPDFFGARRNEGIIEIDLLYISNATYIDNNGTATGASTPRTRRSAPCASGATSTATASPTRASCRRWRRRGSPRSTLPPPASTRPAARSPVVRNGEGRFGLARIGDAWTARTVHAAMPEAMRIAAAMQGAVGGWPPEPEGAAAAGDPDGLRADYCRAGDYAFVMR